MKRFHLAVGSLALVLSVVLAACNTGPGLSPRGVEPSGVPGSEGTVAGPGPYQQPGLNGSGGMMGQGGMMGPQGAPGASGPYQQYAPYGPGGMGQGGMMGGGMMGSGMMGGQGGMMGGSGGYNPQAKPLSLDQATDSVRRYLDVYGRGLSLEKVMEFARNFYAEVEEKDTGIHAMELLIDKFTGQVYPEVGPNTVWNTKYGPMAQMMGGYNGGVAPTVATPIASEQAKVLAQQFLDANLPGTAVADVDIYYGYYTVDTVRGGQPEGMLSVNGYTGAVWYHDWHGSFIAIREFEG